MDEIAPDLAVGRAVPSGDAFLHFDFTLEPDVDLGAELSAAPARSSGDQDVRNRMMISLIMEAWTNPDRWVAISRDRNAYAAIRRCWGPSVTYEATKWATETLLGADLIEERRTRPSAHAKFRSTIRASAKLRAAMVFIHVSRLRPVPSERVRLKDREGHLLNYRDRSLTRALRHDVEAQNEAIGSLAISVTAPHWQRDAIGLLRSGRRVLNPACTTTYRVFNITFDRGGRWFGPWWQGLPSADRRTLTIDGRSTVEHDYRTLHPSLLAAWLGVSLDGDPYTIDGFPRADVKMAFNTMLNANTVPSALGAIRQELAHRGREKPQLAARQLIGAIQARHRGFDHAWGTGVGLSLQNVDAGMCASVQSRMRARGSPVLSVHDSFVSDAASSSVLEGVMNDVMAETTANLAARRSRKLNPLLSCM